MPKQRKILKPELDQNGKEVEPIEILGLSTLSYNALGRGRVTTVQQLLGMTDKQIKSLRGIGEASLKEIKEKLALYKSGELKPPFKKNHTL